MTLFDALWDEIHDANGGRLALSHQFYPKPFFI
jgi:hypothetical protein